GRVAEAVRATGADPLSEALAPFPATAGVLAALVGLPNQEVPGLRVVDAGNFDLTSETGDAAGSGAGAADPLAEVRPAGQADMDERPGQAGTQRRGGGGGAAGAARAAGPPPRPPPPRPP